MKRQVPIVLIGLPGAGKTKVGRALAKVLGLEHLDTDEMIEAQAGQSISGIFASEGEAHFRELEVEAVRKALRREAVISLGGGAIETPAVRELLVDQSVVFIDASEEELLRRIKRNNRRPLLSEDPKRRLAELTDRRKGWYEELASVTVTSSSEPVSTVVSALVKALWNIDVVTVEVEKPYCVFVGSGARLLLPGLVPAQAARTAVFFDRHVEDFAGEVARLVSSERCVSHLKGIPSGEQAKTIEIATEAWDQLGQWHLGRKDLLVGVGGGATTDLSGFIAATWLRGVPVIHCPTTLLAMVDAAVGGKTGINSEVGKNLIGSFYHPLGVIADLDYLETLGPREFRAGFGEIVKCGLIADPEILALLSANPRITELRWALGRGKAVLQELITRAIRVKAEVVSGDMYEDGRREFLNFGHTLAHALEKLSDYQILHGEAVAIGCVFAAELAQSLGIGAGVDPQAVRAQFERLGMATDLSCDPEEVLAVMASDKKVRGHQLRFVVLQDWQKPQTLPISAADVKAALEGFGQQ